MSPIPSSELPGHRRLHERVIYALNRCQEARELEFKESSSWGSLGWKIIRTALGMANLRDGGVVVVGVSERNDRWELTGITGSHLSTYEPDNITDQVNKYASPYVDLDIALVSHEEKSYLAIGVNEFRDTPVVCKKNGPDGSEITRGAVYTRPPGTPRTSKVMRAEEMHDLLELAAEKRARRMMETADRLRDASSSQFFDDELEGL